MAAGDFDAIIVGARCAGSPTAMLLARKGHRVLVVDKATFPSDTISTHLIHPAGMATLRNIGLHNQVTGAGSPPIDTYAFDVGPFAITGSPGNDEEPVSYAPRRTVLDKLLVDAASDAGVEVREAFTVDEIIFDDGQVAGIRGHDRGGGRVVERARVVIGADGRHSTVARAVKAEQYNEKPQLQASYYSYWSGVPMNGRFEAYSRGNRAFAAWPTNDDLTLLVGGWPYDEFEANKADVEGNFSAMIDLVPGFADRVRQGKREERFYGASVPNYFRKPFGPGWALVGDSGYNKDFITAQGITDAFRDAELCTNAVHEHFSGGRAFDEAMIEYQKKRDEHVLPMYEFTCQFAALQPPSPEEQQLMGAIHGNQEAMDGFARMFGAITSPAEFYSEENVGRIFAAAQSRQA